MKKLSYAAFVTIIVAINFAFSGEQIRLYKEFTSGMAYQEVKGMSGILDATELGIPGVLLHREETFGGCDWVQLFSFHGNKLTEVSLVSPNIEQYQPAVLTIANSGFSLVHMESATEELDCISLYRTESQEAVLQAIDKFEQAALNNDHLELLYVDDMSFQEFMPRLTGRESPSQFLFMLPANTRSVTVVATALEDPENPVLAITFSTPKYALAMMREDF